MRRPAVRGEGGGGTAAAPHGQGQESKKIEDALGQIDQDLVDAYLDVPLVTTVHSILASKDPRHDMLGIRKGIEDGVYRRPSKGS